MTALEFTTIGIQILFPLALFAWIALAPMQSRIGFALQAASSLFALIALALTAIWTTPPWWTPFIYLALWLALVLWRGTLAWRGKRIWPQSSPEILGLAILIPLGAWAIVLTSQAISGRTPPKGNDAIDLVFPMGDGVYFVANGGATQVVNGHFLTLNPQTDRQRDYRGQSFAVDLVKLNRWGLRAAGWRPTDPSAFVIFGETVFAPCAGTVIAVGDGMPDMPVPKPDTSALEGNHVVLDCGEYAVLLAHLRQNSLRVREGESVELRTPIGEVGNSGQTFEPHLHIHAQRLAPSSSPLLSGEPLFLRFGSHFPVRNDRFRVSEHDF